jgi:Domain of unknown function (DUF932)
MNTLRSALSAAQAACKIRHTSGAEARLAEAQRVLGLTRGAAERIHQRAEQMAATPITDADWRAFLHRLVPEPADSQTGQTRAANVRDEITRIYYGNRYGQDDVCGTAWGAWQGGRGLQRPRHDQPQDQDLHGGGDPLRAHPQRPEHRQPGPGALFVGHSWGRAAAVASPTSQGGRGSTVVVAASRDREGRS